MNDIFRPYLHKFVLVLFDDILVYRKCMDDCISHLNVVLGLLQHHKLYAKLSKCHFGCSEVEYLGHIISVEGVKADPFNGTCMLHWPIPTSICALRGFLRLTRYCHKFIKGYGTISAPLTNLLRNKSFRWDVKATTTFIHLKQTLTNPHVLDLLDFTKIFVIECDASGKVLGLWSCKNVDPWLILAKGLKAKNSFSPHMRRSTFPSDGNEKWRWH